MPLPNLLCRIFSAWNSRETAGCYFCVFEDNCESMYSLKLSNTFCSMGSVKNLFLLRSVFIRVARCFALDNGILQYLEMLSGSYKFSDIRTHAGASSLDAKASAWLSTVDFLPNS